MNKYEVKVPAVSEYVTLKIKAANNEDAKQKALDLLNMNEAYKEHINEGIIIRKV